MVETVRERIPDGAEEGASYYPVFLDVRGRTALVVGGGAVAERKAAGLARAGACVRVVAPTVTAGLEAQARDGLVDLRRRAFRENDVEGVFLVYAATDDAAVNEAVYAEAEARGVPANVVDDPAHCSFIVPSVVRRGPLQLAVSTSGAAPALAKRLRRELEGRFPEDWAVYVDLLAEVRALVRSRMAGGEAERAPVLEAACDLGVLERLRAGARALPGRKRPRAPGRARLRRRPCANARGRAPRPAGPRRPPNPRESALPAPAAAASQAQARRPTWTRPTATARAAPPTAR